MPAVDELIPVAPALNTAPSSGPTSRALVWTFVCALDQLEPLWGEAALLDGVQVALFLLPDGAVHAVSNQDPATGSFVMSRGIVGSRAGRPTIASPLHKQVFDLVTGECYTHPELRLAVIPVDVRDGQVRIAMQSEAA